MNAQDAQGPSLSMATLLHGTVGDVLRPNVGGPTHREARTRGSRTVSLVDIRTQRNGGVLQWVKANGVQRSWCGPERVADWRQERRPAARPVGLFTTSSHP